MVVQTDEVRDLVDFAPEGFFVTSFYLNVDATEFPSPNHIRKSLDSLLSTAREQFETAKENLSHDAAESIRADLKKIEQWVDDEFHRKDTNGLAIFSCAAKDFWEIINLPTPVENRVVYGPHPYLAPIAAFLSHTKPTAILVTDKEQARILTMKGDEVREWTSIEDFVPHRSEQGGWSQARYQRHSDNWKRHHIDRAAELVLKLLERYSFDWLILGTEVQVESELRQMLHPYVRDRVIGTIHVRADAPVSEIVEKARAVRERAEAKLIENLMQQVQEFVGAGGRGAAGLPPTLEELNEQKVHILLVQQGYRAPGAECPRCSLLLAEQMDACPACDEPTRLLDDVVDVAIQRALELGAAVEVATEPEKLKPIFYIGAILYY